MNTVTVTARGQSDSTRWVRVTVGLRDRRDSEPFLVRDSEYVCAIQPTDAASQSLTSANWESGILSGAGFAWRRWLSDDQGLLLFRLEGSLGGDGIEAIAEATSAAMAALTNHVSQQSSSWVVEIEPSGSNGTAQTLPAASASGT